MSIGGWLDKIKHAIKLNDFVQLLPPLLAYPRNVSPLSSYVNNYVLKLLKIIVLDGKREAEHFL